MKFLNISILHKIKLLTVIYTILFSLSVLAQQTFVVTTTADTGLGSLREAFNNATGNDTIVFSGITYPDTIRLNAGELNISSFSIVIYGPGADSLSISGENSNRIFSFGEGDAEVHGLSFNNGYVYGFENGGAFDVSAGFLSLYDCIVSYNEAIGDPTTPSSAGLGGAFYVDGTLNLVRTAVFNNRSTGGFGNDGYGGAIYQAFGTTNITNSTLSGNRVEGGPAPVGMNVGIGGAIALQSGIMNITSSTLSDNMAVDGAGGGIFNFPSGTVNINNTIVAGNNSLTDPDLSGVFTSLGHNLIFDGGSNSAWLLSDIIGVNPNIGPFRNNGGQTPTHALLPISPAIDVGDTTIIDSIDQRGFPRVQDGNGDEIATIDIGAFEAVVPEKPFNLSAMQGDSLVNLSWQYSIDIGIVQYNIYRDSTLVGNAPVGTTSFIDLNLINGQTYTFNVSAIDTFGFESSLSLPVSATPNGPPNWSIPAGLITFNEDDSLSIDLDNYLFDDSDPDSLLSVTVIPGSFVMISLDPLSHVADFSAPANAFGIDTVIFVAEDPQNLTTYDTTVIRVLPVNDLPVFSPIPDTTILTFTDFQYQVIVNDLEEDSLQYFDNTTLFDIDSTGLIAFRPVISDTGSYQITIFAADIDTVVRDTFALDIQLSTVNSPAGLALTPQDQALTFNWNNPNNSFYSGTRILFSQTAPVTHPDSGYLVLDTTFLSAGSVSATISNLEIAENYYFMIFNYYRENSDIILSNFVTGSDSTLSPQVLVDVSPRQYSVLNNVILDTSITITNNGGGTLLSKLTYSPTPLLQAWFTLDTSLQTVAPFSSVQIPMQFAIPEAITDTVLNVSITLQTNQPRWQEPTFDINVNNLFDRFIPQVSIESEPDSIVTQAAVKLEFSANDTALSQIGDFPQNLFVRYALYNFNTSQFVQAEDSLHTRQIILYPLADGTYELSLWVYDQSGNGKELNDVAYMKRFVVLASQRILPEKKWILSSIPRDQNFTFSNASADSAFVLFRWNAVEEEYKQESSLTSKSGFGYWIYSGNRKNININNIPFIANSDSVVVPVLAGWNQIGVPMPFEMAMNKVGFAIDNSALSSAIPLTQAIADSLIDPAIYWYKSKLNQSGYDWSIIDTTIAEPWQGYWIYSQVNGNLIYPKEPSFRNSAIAPTKLINNLADTWQINLSLKCDDLTDSKNIIGTKFGRKIEIPEPPVLDQFVSLYIKTKNRKLTGIYDSPLTDYSDVNKYDLFFETSRTNQMHAIKWQLPQNNVYFYLVDNHSESIIDMREQNEYVLQPTSEIHGMVIYATYDTNFKPGIIPIDFKLKQNYPNPFNPITTIEFGIPENGADQITTLKIYNVLGEEIVTLLNEKINSGFHKISWSGLNKNNQKVASGLYFYSLSNGKTDLFKKMIFIK